MTAHSKWMSRSLIGVFSSFRADFLWVMLFSLIANLLTLTPTLYMLQVFDRVMISQNELTLLSLTLSMVVFLVAMAFAEWIRSRILVRAGVRFDEKLNSSIFFASLDSNLEKPRGDNTRYFTSLTRLRQFLTGNGIIALLDLPWTPVYLAVLFLMHPLLGWFGVIFTFLLALLALGGNTLNAKRQEIAVNKEAITNTFLASKLRNAELVEALGMLNNLKSRWLRLYSDHSAHFSEAQRRATQFQAFSKFVQYTQQSLVLALGAWLTIKGELSVGAMVASNLLMTNSLRPIGILVGTGKDYANSNHALEELSQLLETYPAKSDGYRAEIVEGQISLQNLSAHAERRPTPILNTLNLQFKSGEVVGIVGPSGAGKSTLARCLLGVWPDYTGKVLLDGMDIREWSRHELGAYIGYLPQDVELLDGTVAENICRFSALDSGAIIEAAKCADIHEMILRLPQGYDTPIGEGGKALSGGQRQRLGLARAIYGKPQVVVLDEPNANLDEAGEAALASAIGTLKAANKTVFMVLHQRNLLALADRVLVMKAGHIIQFS